MPKTTPGQTDGAPRDYVIESNHFIGPRAQAPGELAKAMQKLAQSGQIGDSFLSGKTNGAIKEQARRFGVKIILRNATPGETERKKQKIRVWRSDGLSESDVNMILRDRAAGKPVREPEKCIPDPTVRQQRQKPKETAVIDDVPQS